MHNMPDDVRQYDNNPSSPFYDDGGFDDAVIAKSEDVKADLKRYIENHELDEIDAMMEDHDLSFNFYEWAADNADELAERITAEYHDSIVSNLTKGD